LDRGRKKSRRREVELLKGLFKGKKKKKKTKKRPKSIYPQKKG